MAQKKITISATSAAADTAGIATAAICTGVGPWVPDVASGAGDSLAHTITITQAGASDHSAKTATITGTGPNGEPQTETGLALPNGAATVTGTKYFLTVTSVAISATVGADTMTMGWAAASVTPWKQLHDTNGIFNLGIGCSVVSGSPTYTFQYTMSGTDAYGVSELTAKTTSLVAGLLYPCQAVRLLFAAAGGMSCTVLQA